MTASSSNKRVFGQATRRNGPTRYQRQQGSTGGNAVSQVTEEQERSQHRMELKLKKRAQDEALDERFGFHRYCHSSSSRGESRVSRRGWVFNILPTTVPSGGTSSTASDAVASTGPERAGLDLYFLSVDGSTFKSTVLYDPYFYILAIPPGRNGMNSSNLFANDEEHSVFFETIISNLMRKFEAFGLKAAIVVKKQDLDAPNHLGEVGSKGRSMIKLIFDTVEQLMAVRKEIQPIVLDNQKRKKEEELNPTFGFVQNDMEASLKDPLKFIVDMREYDVPYLVRVCIDLGIRAGAWYTVTPNALDCGVTLSEQDIETKADPSFLAFDIECTKAPLKFPDANVDSIFMISYMVGGQGYLIISRHVVSQDVQDFEYTPKPSYPGPFHIFNEHTEEDLIRRFLSEFQRLKPQIVVTYNGDFFDWPFLEQRCAVYGLDLKYELGVERVGGGEAGGEGEYRGRCCVHMDAFSWVKRDSYLPQGAQGLKAVTKYKLGYDPVEVDPEDMVQFARDRPVHMASYSVSDAVATYYLYMKYVHMFIFSLCTIIPMGPEDVLRKGSGTLCEALLMVQACEKDIICPNKEKEPLEKFHEGHLLESETYIGGKVECLETGVYRSDIEYKFDLKPSAFQMLIDNIDRDLTFAIEVEGGVDRRTVTNYDDIRCQIIEQLELLRDRPNRTEKPYVYHLDVGAMYPNIILTNRLQPSAIVDDSTCAACDFNQAKNNCKRKMNWVWRGDYNPATKSEYDRTKDQLSRERFEGGLWFHELSETEQAKLISTRLKQYSKNAYNRSKVTEEVTRSDTVCMRENDFYVNTVRDFRDKRYELKKLTKVWGTKVKNATDPVSKKEAEDRELVYDSLQVAHKCILNSFYGYVMRKGARWRSMEMAGIVTKTGADLITQARILVEQIGRPLELDTDGIWCILPQSFPDVFYFTTTAGSKLKLEYPCIMLNADVHNNFTNHQYQTLIDSKRRVYETRSECSIFFEVDGPYRCMVLPASTEEGKLLKKRYAVFNFDGSLAELKGFELKRRGELELIKTFQSQVFERFLNGSSLSECYGSVADIANHWLDVIDTQGESLETDELIDLISENRSMSRQLEDYGDQKGTSQTTARRLGEFLGAEIIKDKGLNCKFVIAERPHGSPVTERAIPTAIWRAEPAVMKHFLRKWLKSPQMEGDDFDLRNVLDWDYYRDRLGKTIQKIITIPAALQNIPNPVPRLPHPEWLQRTVRKLNDRYQQKSIRSMFSQHQAIHQSKPPLAIKDIEDTYRNENEISVGPLIHRVRRKNAQYLQTQPSSENGKAKDEKNAKSRVKLSGESFQDWLAWKKNVWKFEERRKRSRQKQVASNTHAENISTSSLSNKKQRKALGGMEGFLRDATQSLADNEWHILEIRDSSQSDSGSASGELVLWVMLSNGSLQRVTITMPRTIYVDCKAEISEKLSSSSNIRRVEKHLPHNKVSKFLYEVTLMEYDFRSNSWLDHFKSEDGENLIISFYELGTSQILRAILHIGCVCRLNKTAIGRPGRLIISDLKQIERPTEGQYLNSKLPLRKIFFYERFYTRTRIGLVAIFINKPTTEISKAGSIDLTSQCFVWIVQPGGEKAQRNVSKKMCESMFAEILQDIHQHTANEAESKYAEISPISACSLNSLTIVDSEDKSFKGVHDVLNTYSQANNGPTMLILNTMKNATQIRKRVPSSNSYPIIVLPSPPGADHSVSTQSLLSLNWEKETIQRCFEAFIHTNVESLRAYIDYARYASIPMGNLGIDPAVCSYDVSFARSLLKHRALLWSSSRPGCPDTGLDYLSLAPGSSILRLMQGHPINFDSNDIWGEENEITSPVVSYPGAYRAICAEIDVHFLVIAALSDLRCNPSGSLGSNGLDVAMRGNNAPLGDVMSTGISLPILRSLVQQWLHDTTEQENSSAGMLLDHVYRLVSSPASSLNDPALHRVVISLMKAAFNQLIGEFQRLGSTIIFANFNRIIISTNKTQLSEAIEYVDFVIATIKKRMDSNDGFADFSRISLQRNTFYAHYLFLDEHNYGGILFENREPEDDDERFFSFRANIPSQEGHTHSITVVPTVQSGWNIMRYLSGEITQTYFQLVIGRFSKDVYRKQIQIDQGTRENEGDSKERTSTAEKLRAYKRNLISKHFASYLTKCVSEIIKERGGPETFPELPGSHLHSTSPVLEFIKNVTVILELDSDVYTEVQQLKKSLLAQISVQEYSSKARWVNPCASFILPGVFCSECQECRDLDLCILPVPTEDSTNMTWACADCATPYNSQSIEQKLADVIERKCLRYQLQDLRCSNTSQVSTRFLSRQSETSQRLKLDITRDEIISQLLILNNLARFYDLEWLFETTNRLLHSY